MTKIQKWPINNYAIGSYIQAMIATPYLSNNFPWTGKNAYIDAYT